MSEEGEARFLNVDLNLASETELDELAKFLEHSGLLVLHNGRHQGQWLVVAEAGEAAPSPKAAISQLLSGLEQLPVNLRTLVATTSRRELDIGLECGSRPFCYTVSVPPELLERAANLGVSLVVSIYAEGKPR